MAKFGVKMTATVALGAIAIATTATIAQAQSRADWLSTGETITYEGYLLADEAVFASCDDDCSDLDMFLYDAQSGELVASDTLVDAVPGVVAPYEGNFLIELVMASCSVEPCATWTESDAGF
ncbi:MULTISPECIES: hypothetical protein [Cyanophyceae]|uniref:hypothetical protein n=1 Tax=Cyanophyceae TaxID=3028117 RepID=UPI00168638BF|nr:MULTISPECIES: hypothetical protein [Cyanophyceae]MBD1914552.1 hypothetical protein [Phormidium sp. FACHB-77]MBD2033051.1 hypothetical protein [Phormidium sp. FACHB-322]MBD2049822.1 hypothetical protein [Leptolyngbya sp. FACHB-60]